MGIMDNKVCVVTGGGVASGEPRRPPLRKKGLKSSS